MLNLEKMLNNKFLGKKLNRVIGITLFIFFQVTLPGMANENEEKLWQLKSQLVINHLADNYIIPRSGDRGKYVMPSLIAYRYRYKDADWQPKQWQHLQLLSNKKTEDFYTNSDAFKAPGIVRLLYLFPQDETLEQVEQQYFQYLFPPKDREKKHNFWTSGGTENFVNMLRTSGYLLAQKAVPLKLPQSTQRLREKEKWLRYKADKTYQTGTAEWDSSSYTIFNLIGWLNVYDFAENEEIKAIAKAVLDYYASAIALKYTYGVYGGAEQRGGSAMSSYNSYTDYLGWLWFSEYIPTEDSFFNWPQYIQLIHPATSSYRPPKEAIVLARKQQPEVSLYQNAKANYGLGKLEIPEVFYIDKTYTLGTALVTNGEQIVNWKLVSYPSQSDEEAIVVTGSNSYGKNQTKNGMGKTLFDRYLQHRNVLVQMSYVPQEVKSQLRTQQFRIFVVNIIDRIPCGNTCQHFLRNQVNKTVSPITYPITKKNHKYYVANYLSFPENTEIVDREGVYFVRLNETYLAIFPFPKQPLKTQVKGNRTYLEVSAPLDTLTGFMIEVGNKIDHNSFGDFQTAIATDRLDLKQLDWEKLRYKTLDERQLLIDYNQLQTQATLRVNNRLITWQPLHLYQGDNLQLKERVLRLESSESVYQVDFQNEVPVFSRMEK
jgi:hypothetical protein